LISDDFATRREGLAARQRGASVCRSHAAADRARELSDGPIVAALPTDSPRDSH